MNLSARRVATLAIGTMLLLFLGLIYAYSVLMAPLKAQFGWSVSGMTLIFAISIVAFTVGNLAAGRIEATRGVRPVYLIGAALLLAGFFGSALVDGPDALTVVYLTYGVLASLGIGLVYNVVIPVVTAWFPDKCGMAQGVSLMGFGMGGFLLGPVATQLYTVVDWRAAFVGIGVVFSALVVACSLVLREPHAEELAALPAAAPAAGASDGGDVPVRDLGVSEMVRTRTFGLLYLFLFMIGSVGMGITGIGRELPASLGADALGAAFIIGFVNVGNGLGRLAAGTLLDRLGRGRTMVGVGALSVAGTALLMGSLALASTALMAPACLVCGLAWGAAVVCMPFVTRTEWGMANMASNMAVVNTYSIFGAVLGSWGAGLLAERLGSFLPVLAIMAAMGILGTLVALLMSRPQRP